MPFDPISDAVVRSIPRTAILASYVPRRCGIATFTHDLVEGLRAVLPDPPAHVVAVDPDDGPLDYPAEVRHTLRSSDRPAYASAADRIAADGVELLVVQHEYGIFGGPSGGHLLDLLAATDLPVIVTLHTVLARPTPLQERILTRVADRARFLVVMSQRTRTVLTERYGVPSAKVAVIPHGVPDFDLDDASAKAVLGLGDRKLLLSLGLLGPGKRVEDVLDALALVDDRLDDVTYAVVGATHPDLVRKYGESYRDKLRDRVTTLGLDHRVRFVDRYLSDRELAAWMIASDVFVTPYANAQQASSGTLAQALAAGAAVVSTPYEYARDLLADGRGVLVPFGDVPALAEALVALLKDDDRRAELGRRGRAFGRSMSWRAVAAQYAALFNEAVGRDGAAVRAATHLPQTPIRKAPIADLPVARSHLDVLRDGDGVTQFAHGSDPDRSSGACTDDVARALLVDVRHARALGGSAVRRAIEADLDFLAAAFDARRGRFRNLRDLSGRWQSATESEDAHGRAIQALGAAVAGWVTPANRDRARTLLDRALPHARELQNLRPRAYVLLGCSAAEADPELRERVRPLSRHLLTVLTARLRRARTIDPGWPWPEAMCTYDNGVVPEAMITAGSAAGDVDTVELGLALLDWLVTASTTPDGRRRPIGNDGWWPRGGAPACWDGQPIEAASLLSAAVAAWQVTGDRRWADEAESWFAWFLGENDLGEPLADPQRGACRDGLRPTGTNPNEGAESTLVWLFGVERIRELRRDYTRSAGRISGGRGQDLTYSSTSDRRAVATATVESAAP